MSDSHLHITPRQASATGHLIDPSEPELLLRVSQGDEAAFAELFDTYQPLLLFMVHRITRDMTEAEEIVQDILLKIWQTRETLAQINNFRNYLFIISRNQALKLVDKKMRQRRREEGYHDEFDEQDAAETKAFHLLDEAIDRLPAQQQRTWLLSRHEGLSYEQIAGVMGLSPRTVQRHISLATESIKAYVLTHNIQLLILILASGYL